MCSTFSTQIEDHDSMLDNIQLKALTTRPNSSATVSKTLKSITPISASPNKTARIELSRIGPQPKDPSRKPKPMG